MDSLFFIPILSAVLIVCIFYIHRLLQLLKDKNTNAYLPYVKKEYLMTNAERNFFKVLQEAAGGKYYIVPQVPLKNIVQVNKYEKLQWKYQNQIDRKCVDFVLFDREYFTPQIAIELDDISHELPLREDRDRFVDAIMQKVGLRIMHIKTAHTYDLTEDFAKIDSDHKVGKV